MRSKLSLKKILPILIVIEFSFSLIPFPAFQHCRKPYHHQRIPFIVPLSSSNDSNEDSMSSSTTVGQSRSPSVPQRRVDSETLKSSISRSNVPYTSVYHNLNELYPSQGLQIRNAASRTDGYWAFIKDGKEPPLELTYGEFDLDFFAYLLDCALHWYTIHNDDNNEKVHGWNEKVFADIGSGTGRLVVGASALHPGWKLCHGIEVLPGLHKLGVETLMEHCVHNLGKTSIDEYENSDLIFRISGDFETYHLPSSTSNNDANADANDNHLPLAPIQLSCASVLDPKIDLSDISCAFITATCMSSELLNDIGEAIGRQCKPGTIVITTDYMLPLEGRVTLHEDDKYKREGPFAFQLLEKIDGPCAVVGGISTAHIHVVTKSLFDENK